MNEEQKIVAVLSVIIYLVMTGVTIISPILPRYAETFIDDLFLVGFLVGSFAFARVFLGLPAGIIGDRLGNKRIMALGLIIISGSSLFAYLAFNYYALLTARILEGAGSAFFATMSTSYLAKNTSIERRGRYMGFYVGMLLMGQVSGPGIGGFVAVNFGLNAPFLFYALVSAVGLLILFLFIKKDEPASVEEASNRNLKSDLKLVFSNRSFLIVNLGTLAAFFARGGIIATIFPILADKNFGYGPEFIGIILTLVAIASLFTMLPSGIIADRYGRKLPFTASMILGGISALFIPLAEDLVGLVAAMFIFGLSLGLSGPMAAWAADLSDPETMGTAMGLYRTIGDTGFILGPLILTGVSSLVSSDCISTLPFVVCYLWLVLTGLALLLAKDPAGKKRVISPPI